MRSVLVLLGALTTGCKEERSNTQAAAAVPERPHVLLITLDTTRRDALGCYGPAWVRTPELDAIAEASVIFEDALTPVPTTLPAHSSLLTGLYPQVHGVHDNSTYVLPERATTLVEILSQAGYRTAAAVSAVVLSRESGIAQGVQVFEDRFPAEDPKEGVGQRTASAVTDAALRALDDVRVEALDQSAAPFFLWVHYFDPHQPYNPPLEFGRPWLDRARSDPELQKLTKEQLLYAAEVEFMDREIGRLVREVESRTGERRLLLCIAADHGESLGEHGEPSHSFFLYQATVSIPMLVRSAAFPPGRVAATVSLVDILPTFLELLSLKAPRTLQGRSLLPYLQNPEGRGPGEDRKLLLEARVPFHEFGWAWLEAIRVGRWKYVDAPRPELYDLLADPREQQNLVPERSEMAQQLAHDLQELNHECRQLFEEQVFEEQEPQVSPQEFELLVALGYTTVHAALPESKKDLPDGKDLVQLLALRDDGILRMVRGRYSEALQKFEELLRQNPDPSVGTLLLATCSAQQAQMLRSKGRMEEARAAEQRSADHWSKIVELHPANVSYQYNLAVLLHALGQTEPARAQLQQCVQALEAQQKDSERAKSMRALLETWDRP